MRRHSPRNGVLLAIVLGCNACSTTAPAGSPDLEVVVTVVDQAGNPAAMASGGVDYIDAGEALAYTSFETDASGLARVIWSRDDGHPDSVFVAVWGRQCGRYTFGSVLAGAAVEPHIERLAFSLSIVRAALATTQMGMSCAHGRAHMGDFWLYLHVDSVISQGPIDRLYGIWRMPYTAMRIDDRGSFFGTTALGDLVLDLDGIPNYGCSPIRFRLVARGMADSTIGPAFFESVTPCIEFSDTVQLVQTDSLPWFP